MEKDGVELTAQDEFYLECLECGEVFDSLRIAFLHQSKECEDHLWRIVPEEDAF